MRGTGADVVEGRGRFVPQQSRERQLGFRVLRIIHGRGIGVQREIVRGVISDRDGAVVETTIHLFARTVRSGR